MAKAKSTYSEKLRDPRWQRIRLKALERDEFTCQMCFDSENPLFVHHGYYVYGLEPWEYPLESLHTCCEECHVSAEATKQDLKVLLGTMSLDEQWQIAEMLRAIKVNHSYGERLCGLSAMADPELFTDATTKWHAKMEAKRVAGL